VTPAARDQELAAIYENIPGIVFYVAVEPNDEFRFLSISRSGLAATGLTRDQIVGRLVRDVIPPPSAELVLGHYRDAIRTRCTVRWKEVSEYPAGRRVGEVAVTPIFDAHGNATHLVGVVHDVTERDRLEHALRQREDRLAFLLRLNDTLRPLHEPVDIQNAALRLLGEHLGLNRVTYAALEGDDFNVSGSWMNGVAPLRDRAAAIATLGRAFREACTREETFAVHDVRTDPRLADAERAGLLAHEIGAYAGTPVRYGEGFLAVVVVHNATPRIWTPADLELLRSVAERIWAAVEHAYVEYALRAAHQELLESEERFSMIHDRAPFAISLTSTPDGRIVTVNEAFERLFEFSRAEVLGKTRVELGISTPEWNRALVDELEQHPVVRNFEVRRLTKTGAERFLLLSIDPVRIGDSEFLLTTAVDVTEKKHAEAALREREQRLRLALDASQAGSWTRDFGSNHLDWDEGARRIYGFSADQQPTFEAWLDRVHEEDRPSVLSLLNDQQHRAEDSWDATFRIVRPDGTIAWIQSLGRADRGPDGRVTRLTGLELDVTARRLAEEAIHARREEEHSRELRLLVQNAAQGIVSLDAQGRILMANRAVEAMFGWATGELVGQRVEHLVPSFVREADTTDRHSDLIGQRKNGSTFPIELSLSEVITSEGRRAIAFVTDMTERRRAAAALHERTVELEHRTAQLRQLASDLTLAEQNAREELAKTLHDGLQQLLVVSAISLDQQLRTDVEQRTPSPLLAQTRKHLDDAIAAARSLSFELSPPLLKTSGLPAALNWLANWMRDKYGLEVQLSADPHADSARNDVRTLLFESVRELLFNVVKHAGVHEVVVDLALDPDQRLCISVTDQGIGFDPTSVVARTKAGQGGWGLFSIRERLTLLGGQFEIESAPGDGTRFRLIAPIARAMSAAPTRTLRILLVDDHAGMRDALRRLLNRPEFEVVGDAGDGVEAIAQVRALQPDVVLMDVAMPRMDGVEATRRLCGEFPFIQILGLSAQSRVGERHEIEQAGAVGFFTKAADMRRVLDRLLIIHARHSLGVTAN
jgi:PAS domain S-box-containing protein